MGKKHFIYMNGSSGCLPDNIGVSFDVDGCVSEFETIFGDDLYQHFNLAKAIDDDVIDSALVYGKLEEFFADELEFVDDEDEFIEQEYAFLIEQGYVERKYSNERMEAIEAFGEAFVQAAIEEFRETGHISLGPGYGADYASWGSCTCDEPWDHSEEGMEAWLQQNGDEWFTEPVEVKLRYLGDRRPWEAIEPLEIKVSEKDDELVERTICRHMINHGRRVKEVRWSWLDNASDQGHYFVPEYEGE